MMRLSVRGFAAIFFVVGYVLGIGLIYYFFAGFWCDKEDALSKQVADQRNTIKAYQQALIGEERNLLSMYDSVQPAGQIDIVVHGDTESGLPVKFILDCGGDKK